MDLSFDEDGLVFGINGVSRIERFSSKTTKVGSCSIIAVETEALKSGRGTLEREALESGGLVTEAHESRVPKGEPPETGVRKGEPLETRVLETDSFIEVVGVGEGILLLIKESMG